MKAIYGIIKETRSDDFYEKIDREFYELELSEEEEAEKQDEDDLMYYGRI